MEVLDGELGEALVDQVRFAFGGDRFEPDEDNSGGVATRGNYSIRPLLMKNPEAGRTQLESIFERTIPMLFRLN